MLDAIEEAFDQIAGAKQRATVAAPPDPVRAWRNDGFRSCLANSLHEGFSIVALVRDDSLRRQTFNQFSRARNVGNFALNSTAATPE